MGLASFSWDDSFELGFLYFEDDFESAGTVCVNNVVLEFDSSGELVGIEFLTKGSLPEKLKDLID